MEEARGDGPDSGASEEVHLYSYKPFPKQVEPRAVSEVMRRGVALSDIGEG